MAPTGSARTHAEHRDHRAYRRGEDHRLRADPFLYRRRSTRSVRSMRARPPWTGCRRSRSAGSPSPRRRRPPSGATIASTSSIRPGTWTSPSRWSAASGCSMVRSSSSTVSPASSRSPRRCGARPTAIACRASASSTSSTGRVRTSGATMNATILRPWYVLGPGHRWPYFLIPIYKLMELLPSTREGATRLGLVTLEQMVRALVRCGRNPSSRSSHRRGPANPRGGRKIFCRDKLPRSAGLRPARWAGGTPRQTAGETPALLQRLSAGPVGWTSRWILRSSSDHASSSLEISARK